MMLSIPTGIDLRTFEQRVVGARIKTRLTQARSVMRRFGFAVLGDLT
jgi:hypothetical protein